MEKESLVYLADRLEGVPCDELKATMATLHVVAGGIREGAQVLGVFTDPGIAERVKKAAWNLGRWDGVAVTAVVIDAIDPAFQATIDTLE
ncbi:hypothetical protein FSY45_20065 [Comamonas sp. Z1]|uniref:hypothetical protein n=1 Tax=Comamonas sp. Z1 TaxID=2601246 RepID=UPI0011E6F9A6|nr:hypothetical protein [Comamonas sp. Z1]TYK74137.1 hypothetical protein FSY45_20065 [Comamonas sp. Z1]